MSLLPEPPSPRTFSLVFVLSFLGAFGVLTVRSCTVGSRVRRCPHGRDAAQVGRFRDRPRGRPRRHGRRLRGAAAVAQPPGGPEGAVVGPGPVAAGRRSLPPRGGGGGP